MNKIFYMAGIYNENGCAIVTKESDKNINHIHHRQPLVLDNINMMNWLNMEDLSIKRNINKINYYHKEMYWEEIIPKEDYFIIEKDEFYILRSKEKIIIPNTN